MENKQQMVHIASEIIVLIGLTFYFNQKNKKLMGHIEDLSQRVEEQEDLLQKHEQVIRKLVDFINQSQTKIESPIQQTQQQVQKSQKVTQTSSVATTKSKNGKSSAHKESPLIPPNETTSVPFAPARVSFNQTLSQLSIDEESSEEQSDLDAELAEELQELESNDERELELDLKKQ